MSFDMAEVAVRVEKLCKRYEIGALTASASLRETLAGFLRRPFARRARVDSTIWALQDVSLEVPSGSALGIIGSNGAGKTTLLRILSRITHPTSGYGEINGRVGSLLEVGTGFHPELTGRENIYLSGAILGMRRAEIAGKFDEIVAFADVAKFIDTPVKRYSSGMFVRLAFAVAAHLEPEILLVDEVLAVGDAQFQRKCLGKMDEVAKAGRTILFVSHNLSLISKLCDSAVWIDQGRVLKFDEAKATVNSYLAAGLQSCSGSVSYPEPAAESDAHVTRLELRNNHDEAAAEFDVMQPIRIRIAFRCRRRLLNLRVDLVVYLPDAFPVFVSTSQDYDHLQPPFEVGEYMVEVTVPGPFLASGEYFLSAGLCSPGEKQHDLREYALSFRVSGNPFRQARSFGLIAYPFPWRLLVGSCRVGPTSVGCSVSCSPDVRTEKR